MGGSLAEWIEAPILDLVVAGSNLRRGIMNNFLLLLFKQHRTGMEGRKEGGKAIWKGKEKKMYIHSVKPKKRRKKSGVHRRG